MYVWGVLRMYVWGVLQCVAHILRCGALTPVMSLIIRFNTAPMSAWVVLQCVVACCTCAEVGCYGVASIRWLLKIIGLFCKRDL